MVGFPSPSVNQAVNGGYPWLEIKCSRCKTSRAAGLAALPCVATTFVHDLGGWLRCRNCRKAGKRPAADLLQLWQRSPIGRGDVTRRRDRSRLGENWNIFYDDVHRLDRTTSRRAEPRRSMGMKVRILSWLRPFDRRTDRDL
ncbi:hypothetical protein BraRD5C2_40050 [Bradyrhizobium sp. RD5-C2]|nr:hypothetical protein BraRD5C2_40050 [Bradyrhizobium sp. RD5-C2]